MNWLGSINGSLGSCTLKPDSTFSPNSSAVMLNEFKASYNPASIAALRSLLPLRFLGFTLLPSNLAPSSPSVIAALNFAWISSNSSIEDVF